VPFCLQFYSMNENRIFTADNDMAPLFRQACEFAYDVQNVGELSHKQVCNVIATYLVALALAHEAGRLPDGNFTMHDSEGRVIVDDKNDGPAYAAWCRQAAKTFELGNGDERPVHIELGDVQPPEEHWFYKEDE